MKEVIRSETLTVELLESNGWTWEYPNDHCQYKYYSKKGVGVSLKYYHISQDFVYERRVSTVGELKDLCKIIYGQKINIKLIS